MRLAQRNSSSPHRRLGFTLVEVMVAVSLLGLLAGGSIWTLAQANNYASIARLYTGAETAAQNQIDFLLSDGPFNPQSTPSELGSEIWPQTFPKTYAWTVGTHPSGATAPSAMAEDVTIYTEPPGTNGQVHAVHGIRTTTVTVNTVTTLTQSLNLYSATVVVTYTYRSKNYRVQLNAMRASDV